MTHTISVAICTRNHPDELAECLRSLVPIRDKALEVIVIDNASDGDTTRKVAEAFDAKYVREPSIGLVHARNRAIVTAEGDIIVFTDDDCQAGAGWLDAFARAFSDQTVGAVTGQAISGSDTNWVQRQYNSFARGFCTQKPVEMTPEAVGDIYYRAVIGVGANMAFRRALLVALDGFAQNTLCGEDDYMLASVVRAGYKVRYTPDSIVYQKHRTGLMSTLVRMFEYSVGAVRVLWLLSAEDKSFGLFVKNICWMLDRSGLRQLLKSAVYVRVWHVLFNLASLLGFGAGLFLPWGWRAHIFGELPARGGLNRPELGQTEGLPVLMYHRVGPALRDIDPGLTVEPGRFRKQLGWLKRNGYETISASDLLARRLEDKPLPEKPVLLTFDDAYADLVEHAFPMLREHGFTATVFVVTGEIGGRNSWDIKQGSAPIRCMSADDILRWSEEGIEFGAHSRTHPDLNTLPAAGLEEEITGSGRDLAAILGEFPGSFAYPFGNYNDAVKSTVEKEFKLAFTCEYGLNSLSTEPHLLHRIAVQPKDALLEFVMRVKFGFHPVEYLFDRVRHYVRFGTRVRGLLRALKVS
jgi:peptidoglycan/xylan/chitin deacetylase (PgdA/CDA1 family)/glycosyltransferase involved in cell wall biosynthesis